MRSQHRRPHFLLHLILAFLGFKALRHHMAEDCDHKEQFKSKGRMFRSKLHEAFSVWDEPEQAESGAAPAEQQG